jgi:hypothetical protein
MKFVYVLIGLLLLFPLAENQSRAFFPRCAEGHAFPCVERAPQ